MITVHQCLCCSKYFMPESKHRCKIKEHHLLHITSDQIKHLAENALSESALIAGIVLLNEEAELNLTVDLIIKENKGEKQ